jgi:pimeloyl-ACP methyl ester carboxylesterase
MLRWVKYFFLLIAIIIFVSYFIPFKNSDFKELYVKNDSISASLEIFRNRPLKKITFDGVEWQYYTGGNGKNCLLFIHGMGGTYDFWWNQILFFENDYKIISYTLPLEINSLEKVEQGITAILKQENVVKFIPIGTSMGGYITQYLMHQHPEKVEKAVLGNTFPPNDFIIKENATNRKIIPLLPALIVGKIAENHLKKDIFPTSENNELLEAFLLSVPFSKKGLAGRFDVVTDYFEPYTDLPKLKSIPKLIFESDNDPMITPDLRMQLKQIYPEAEVYTFHNKGHFPYINAVDAYNAKLKNFLEN